MNSNTTPIASIQPYVKPFTMNAFFDFLEETKKKYESDNKNLNLKFNYIFRPVEEDIYVYIPVATVGPTKLDNEVKSEIPDLVSD